MPLSYNDLRTHGLTRTRVTVDTNDVTSGVALRVMKILVSDASAVTGEVNIYNALTITGTDRINIAYATGPTAFFVDLAPNGERFDVGLTIDILSGSPEVNVWYLLDG